MMRRPRSELQFVKSSNFCPALEVHVDDSKESQLHLGRLLALAIKREVEEDTNLLATIYAPMIIRISGPVLPQRLILEGPHRLLELFHNSLCNQGLEVEQITCDSKNSLPIFHLQEGIFWRREDASTWCSIDERDDLVSHIR